MPSARSTRNWRSITCPSRSTRPCSPTLKPKFIHHPDSKKHIQQMLRDTGCDLEKTYFDVPRMRTATSDDYLTTGIAYAFHPHRDTWYSAPLCQINWWLPDLTKSNRGARWRFIRAIGRRPSRTDRATTTTRSGTGRVASRRPNRSSPTRAFNRSLKNHWNWILRRVSLHLWASILLFSAAQMHSTVPNSTGRTRFSIDFRTVHNGDAEKFRGAPNVDSSCTGTTMNDYLRATDLTHLDPALVSMYERRPWVRTPSPIVDFTRSVKNARR